MFNSLELCAGAGGQAIGLEKAGIEHDCLVEIDKDACNTLRLNRPDWHVSEKDINNFDASSFRGIDFITGGFPCPPYSIAGKQLGPLDERDLFDRGMEIISETRPKACIIENVKGILSPQFEEVRQSIKRRLKDIGYELQWRLLNAADYGVSQLRPRVIFVALPADTMEFFTWPQPSPFFPIPVGERIKDLMGENGWLGLNNWVARCNDIAPTLVGGSKKHGGADLGPTRSKRAWLSLGVDGKSLANHAPDKDFIGVPKLTLRMAARLQGFPDDWQFSGKKTSIYRQIANAFPPPVAEAVGKQVILALEAKALSRIRKITA